MSGIFETMSGIYYFWFLEKTEYSLYEGSRKSRPMCTLPGWSGEYIRHRGENGSVRSHPCGESCHPSCNKYIIKGTRVNSFCSAGTILTIPALWIYICLPQHSCILSVSLYSFHLWSLFLSPPFTLPAFAVCIYICDR